MDQFMKRALELAAANVKEGGQPYGAVIVKDGRIVAEGVNTLHRVFDSSGHAELLAVRSLQAQIKSLDLSGYTMYASGEPCLMCQSAMYLAGLHDIYYCQTMEDAIENGFPEEECLSMDKLKQLSASMKHIVLEEGLEDPIKQWSALHAK